MANTGEIQDLTVSWEGYAGSSVEAFIKKEFTSVLSGDIGTPVENYTSSGSIMPISKVYTLDGLCVTPIVENVSGALGESTTIYFPHFYKESSFEETEKLEFYKFQYSGGRWDEIGYHYVDTEDNLPSWIMGQIISKLPTATTSANGLMSSADKTALGNKVDKVEGKGLSTNDFVVIELSDYTSSDDALPTDDNLIYTYRGKVVEKRMCKLDGDNEAILFITNRDLSDYEMDDLVVLAYIRSGGSDYNYTFDGLYYTNNSECPRWVKSACGITYATSENAGLMSPTMYDDLIESQKKQTVKNIDNSSSSTTSATVNVGYDYLCTNAVNTFQFDLSGSDGYIGLLFTTGTTPNITFNASSNIYAQDGLSFEANSIYEVSIKHIGGYYYVTAVKMVQLN